MVRIAALCVFPLPLSVEKIAALKRPTLAIHHFRSLLASGAAKKSIRRFCVDVPPWFVVMTEEGEGNERNWRTLAEESELNLPGLMQN